MALRLERGQLPASRTPQLSEGETAMNELGRLEDLPKDYVQDLRNLNLVPLWPSLRGVLPPHVPNRQTQPPCWAYIDIKPLLLKAG
jgi:gentisate 1,2-dioxygenase